MNKSMSAAKPPLYICLGVWGSHYLGIYSQYGLPSQLSPNNIPALSEDYELHYWMYISKRDIGAVKDYPSIKELENYATVHFQDLGNEKNFYKYVLSDVSNKAFDNNAYLVVLEPHSIYADGSLKNLKYYVDDGIDSLGALGLNVDSREISRYLSSWHYGGLKNLSFSVERLVKLGIEYMHPVDRASFWGDFSHPAKFSSLFITLGPNSFLAYSLKLNILLTRPRTRLGIVNSQTQYLKKLLGWGAKNQSIADSANKFFFLRLNATNQEDGGVVLGRLGVRAIVSRIAKSVELLNLKSFSTPIWICDYVPNSSDIKHKEDINLLFQSTILESVYRSSRLRFERRLYEWQKNWKKFQYLLSAEHYSNTSSKLIGKFRRAINRSADYVLLKFSWLQKIVFRLEARLRKIGVDNGVINPRAAGALIHELLHERRELALGLLKSGAIDQYEMIASPLDLGENVQNPDQFSDQLFDLGISALNKGNLEAAAKALELATRSEPAPEKIFYRNLINNLIRLRDEANVLANKILAEPENNSKKSVFSAVVWGNEYIDNFMKYTLRSLLASGNLPSLKNQGVYFSIVTTPSGVGRIQSSPYFDELREYAEVVFFEFPEELSDSFHYSKPSFDYYRLYGALDHTGIHLARALSANLYFIVVDAVVANNSIRNLDRFIDDGYQICANASIVSNRETFLPALDTLYGDKKSIDINSRQLANLGLSHLHNYVTNRLVVAENESFDKYPRELYFPTESGLVVHALYQHPLVISADAIKSDIIFDYFIVDSKLMGRIMTKEEQFKKMKVVVDSDEVYVANFAPKERIFDSTGRPLNINDFVSVHLESLPVHHYIWKHQQLIRCDTNLRTHVNPSEIADKYLSALMSRLDGQSKEG
jgi:hypothetical protein